VSEKTSDQAALEALVVENPDLERLETLLEQFNIFEALEAVHVEVRHSAFLSYLLSPSENHGLGDLFVKQLLKRALSTTVQQSYTITPIDLDVWDLNNLIVLREWQNIDLLLIDEVNKLVVVVENKINSEEHSDQLSRYRQIILQHYPDWHKIYLFLSPEGDLPSDESYIPVDYIAICELLEQIVANRSSSIGPDVLMAIQQYTRMLRRHIVSESEITELCQKIYRKHKKALDMIFDYRPDLQGSIWELLETMIKEQDELVLDHSSKSYIRFGVKEWDTTILLQGEGWTRSGRILLFEFQNFSDKLSLYLTIGPGPIDTRNKLFELAKEHKPPFKIAFRTLGKYWSTIDKYPILEASSYEGLTMEEIEADIRKKWKQYLEHNFVDINTIIKRQKWIFEASKDKT